MVQGRLPLPLNRLTPKCLTRMREILRAAHIPVKHWVLLLQLVQYAPEVHVLVQSDWCHSNYQRVLRP